MQKPPCHLPVASLIKPSAPAKPDPFLTQWASYTSLHNNRLTGELPSSFKNCSQLRVLDLGKNALFDEIRTWIGGSLQDLIPSPKKEVPIRPLGWTNTSGGWVLLGNASHGSCGLIALNRSRNNLTGPITPKIGQLKSLDFLDLSRNLFSGSITSSLSQLSGLGVLDLSCNNSSGKITLGTQF
ncbi:hypothetical protein WN944_024274 [Citrus x changshan-huyou]|uniref:Uncharacterized protein n=1 Tax=Citrus x changshan-huyou TaxID=2935761 RepID=A0AAP0LN89_9ROSI